MRALTGPNAASSGLTGTRMTEFDNIMHFIAQGAINISEGLTEVEADSPVHRAMSDLCRLVSEGKVTYTPKED